MGKNRESAQYLAKSTPPRGRAGQDWRSSKEPPVLIWGKRRRPTSILRLATLFLALLAASPVAAGRAPDAPLSPLQPTPMPGLDRLAEPVLPESPTQVDRGRRLYYFNCMPCHGDRGQGLTDEWREVWVEDHQNCWGRGCHSGKPEMDAFYLPRFVPPLFGSPYTLASFQGADGLFAFLRDTQPPQRPGALADEEYWDLTAFLLYENGRLAADEPVGPQAAVGSTLVGVAALAALLLLLAVLGVLGLLWQRGRRRRKPSSQTANGGRR